MKRPKKQDFEYYQKGLVFKTVDLIKYSKAQDLYIDHLKALNMHVVGSSFKNIYTPNTEPKNCKCEEAIKWADTVEMSSEPDKVTHFINGRLSCEFKL